MARTSISNEEGRLMIGDTRRTLPTLDWVVTRPDKNQIETIITDRKLAATHFYQGLGQLKEQYHNFLAKLPPVLPNRIAGTVLQPDGQPAPRILVAFQPPVESGKAPRPEVTAVTNSMGAFHLSIPMNTPIPEDNLLVFRFKAANTTFTKEIEFEESLMPGLLGNIMAETALEPLSESIVGNLVGMFGGMVMPTSTPSDKPMTEEPVEVRLGEGDCPLVFHMNMAQERFPYSMLIRLVEPRTSILTESIIFGERGNGGRFHLALRNLDWLHILPTTQRSFTDRVAVDQPISVDGFRDRIIGNENGFITPEETVPMAGTLGLGYVVRMAQEWQPSGLSLGDLVYSLPLAPGEQQRIAVFEQRQTLSTRDFESLEQDEFQRQQQIADSSTQATFDSAFSEMIRGSSSYATRAESSSWGVAGGIGAIFGPIGIGIGAGGGGGSSSASGVSNNSLDGARHYTSAAAEWTHSAVERQSSARRRAQRTSIRLSTATDTETAVTKVITNNNRTHAMTVQYWEVLRHFDVSTVVDGVTLVCFVPLEVVRFLPPRVKVELDPLSVSDRSGVLYRYGQLLKHADILRKWLPVEYRSGLTLLEEFASDPRAVPSLPTSFAEDVLDIRITGSFLPFEDIYVSIITRRGTRIGPTKLAGGVPPLPDKTDPTHAFATETELFAELRKRRQDTTGIMLTANMALPPTVAPNDVIGFELTRIFRPLSYQLVTRKDDLASIIAQQTAVNLSLPFLDILSPYLQGVHYSASELEAQLGGPIIWNFNAKTGGPSGETFAADYIDPNMHMEMPTGTLPIPALQVKPLLKFSDLLKIEQTLQHVVRNTVTYSKAVWMSLTPEERAIMLEGYTIGVPEGGIEDETQNVPLLNCVTNQVLGYYGNCMIMPFNIPKVVVDMIGLTTGQIQEALTNFHRTAFSPPVSHITLPTHGVLGEAVLGQCPSAEKIDLTRFWNWQDSPIPQAPDISTLLPGQRGINITTATAPANLTSLPSIVTNVNAPADGGGGEVLKALIGAKDTRSFTDITGMKELAELTTNTLKTAETARADALGKAQSLASEALKQLPELVKADAAAKAESKKESEAKKTELEANLKKVTESLKGNATTYLSVANAEPNQTAADNYAKKVITELAGKDGLPASWAAQLYEAYHVTGSGGNLTQGSKAFLKALGLPTS
jgi:hypothetical protein